MKWFKVFLLVILFYINSSFSQTGITIYEINENRSDTKDLDNSYKNKLNIQLNIKPELLKGCSKFKILKLDEIIDNEKSKMTILEYTFAENTLRELEDRPTIYLKISRRKATFIKKISGTIALYKKDNSIQETISFNFIDVKLP